MSHNSNPYKSPSECKADKRGESWERTIYVCYFAVHLLVVMVPVMTLISAVYGGSTSGVQDAHGGSTSGVQDALYTLMERLFVGFLASPLASVWIIARRHVRLGLYDLVLWVAYVIALTPAVIN